MTKNKFYTLSKSLGRAARMEGTGPKCVGLKPRMSPEEYQTKIRRTDTLKTVIPRQRDQRELKREVQ